MMDHPINGDYEVLMLPLSYPMPMADMSKRIKAFFPVVLRHGLFSPGLQEATTNLIRIDMQDKSYILFLMHTYKKVRK